MKYFIDCGSHFFQGLKDFDKMYKFDSKWTVFSFEANPVTYSLSKKSMPTNTGYQLFHENKAIWKDNSGAIVHCEGEKSDGCSSTIIKDPPAYDKAWGSKHQWTNSVKIPSVRLVDILQRVKPDSEKVVVKLDIEGAEFDVLHDVIQSNSLHLIDDLCVEFHERFFMEKEQEYADIKSSLIKTIEKTCKKFEGGSND
jgi:FkbM family methyltransferase